PPVTYGYIYIVRRDGSHGRAFPIDKTSLLIGRSEMADIRIQLGTVEDQHARITFDPTSLLDNNDCVPCGWLENLATGSGVLVNDSVLLSLSGNSRIKLSEGDRFVIGERAFIFKYPPTISAS